jgi:16S rRNA C967 or C1407 C5-methylase (RsmB/RsmF family)
LDLGEESDGRRKNPEEMKEEKENMLNKIAILHPRMLQQWWPLLAPPKRN